MEWDEDDELLDEGAGVSGLDFSDDQGDNTSAVITREQSPHKGWN